MGGNDVLNGGDGIDTAIYSGTKSTYTIGRTNTGFTVASQAEGTDTLIWIERLTFSDTKVALDLDGAAGTAALLIGALLGKASLQNQSLVGAVIGMVDSGQTLADLSQLAVTNGIVSTLTGGPDNISFVKLLLRNVLGSDADTGLVSTLDAMLNAGTFTQSSLLTAAAQLDANKVQIDLVGLGITGIEYA